MRMFRREKNRVNFLPNFCLAGLATPPSPNWGGPRRTLPVQAGLVNRFAQNVALIRLYLRDLAQLPVRPQEKTHCFYFQGGHSSSLRPIPQYPFQRLLPSSSNHLSGPKHPRILCPAMFSESSIWGLGRSISGQSLGDA